MTANLARAVPAVSENILKMTQFRRLLDPQQTSFIMEVHNGLSARIVEEAGFEGIWASGLSIPGQWLDIDDALDLARARNLL
jgi:2-methylisocitrate lyase-like PEP mutase family enzyme